MNPDRQRVFVETLGGVQVLSDSYPDEIEASEAMDQWGLDDDEHKIVWRAADAHRSDPPPKHGRCGGRHFTDEPCSNA